MTVAVEESSSLAICLVTGYVVLYIHTHLRRTVYFFELDDLILAEYTHGFVCSKM